MLPSEYHLTFKMRSTTRPTCTNLHAGKVDVLLFFTQAHLLRKQLKTLTTINPLFFIRDIKYSKHNTHEKFVTYSANVSNNLKDERKPIR